MIEVIVTTRSAAPAERVFALLADAASWTRWARLDDVSSEGEAGMGEIRVFRSAGVTTRERVTAFEPGRRFAYEFLGGLPVVDCRVEVLLDETGRNGTEIVWRSQFRPMVPARPVSSSAASSGSSRRPRAVWRGRRRSSPIARE